MSNESAKAGIGAQRDEEFDHLEPAPPRRVVQHASVETGAGNHAVDVDAEFDDDTDAFGLLPIDGSVEHVDATRLPEPLQE